MPLSVAFDSENAVTHVRNYFTGNLPLETIRIPLPRTNDRNYQLSFYGCVLNRQRTVVDGVPRTVTLLYDSDVGDLVVIYTVESPMKIAKVIRVKVETAYAAFAGVSALPPLLATMLNAPTQRGAPSEFLRHLLNGADASPTLISDIPYRGAVGFDGISVSEDSATSGTYGSTLSDYGGDDDSFDDDDDPDYDDDRDESPF